MLAVLESPWKVLEFYFPDHGGNPVDNVLNKNEMRETEIKILLLSKTF